MGAERARLEALDRIGRPQVSVIVDAARGQSVGGAPPPDWEEEGETRVYDPGTPFWDAQSEGHESSEVFFQSGREEALTEERAHAGRDGRENADVAVRPSRIDAAALRKLVPWEQGRREGTLLAGFPRARLAWVAAAALALAAAVGLMTCAALGGAAPDAQGESGQRRPATHEASSSGVPR
jgi:hypothetical protein